MGVRIFLSSNSGNKEIENSQQRIDMVLTTRAIEFVTIDISAPGMQEMRSFMRERGRKREGQRNVLPPQIFNGEEYRGDYEGFDIANEDDDLEEFLGIPRKNPKVEPVKTGAVASDVGKLNPGKLMQDEMTGEDENQNEDSAEMMSEEIQSENEELDKDRDDLKESLEEDILQKKNSEHTLDNKEISSENEERETLTEKEKHEDGFKDWKHSVEEQALQNEAAKVSEKTDGLMGKVQTEAVMDNDEYLETHTGNDDIKDSSDESSDEDTAVEYMPDGELVRKKSRGFKQLNNCKRFWKASLVVG